MQKFLDSPLGYLLRVLGDLITVNLLFVLCGLPIVTLGASASAMYAVLLKLVRGEHVYVIRTFFKNWKDNFLKATAIWLIFLAMAAVVYADVLFAYTFEGNMRYTFLIVATVVGIIALLIMTLGTLQLSNYENTLKNYIKNSFLLAACAPGWLILAWAVWVAEIFAIFVFGEYVIRFGFIFLMWGISGPAYATAYCANRIFTKVENAQQA